MANRVLVFLHTCFLGLAHSTAADKYEDASEPPLGLLP